MSKIELANETVRIFLPGTNALEVASTLSRLANFPHGSLLNQVTNIWHARYGSLCAVGYHLETLQTAKEDDLLPLPDFIVSRAGNIYLIDLGKRLHPNLVNYLQEEIKQARKGRLSLLHPSVRIFSYNL